MEESQSHPLDCKVFDKILDATVPSYALIGVILSQTQKCDWKDPVFEYAQGHCAKYMIDIYDISLDKFCVWIEIMPAVDTAYKT